MLTIFTTPRPLDHPPYLAAFLNAIRSWRRIIPQPEILVFGGNPGFIESEGGIPISTFEQATPNGHPYFDSFIRTAESLASNDILMYATDHLIFTYDLIPVIELISTRFPGPFLIIGRRWSWLNPSPINFIQGWEGMLRQQVVAGAKCDSTGAKDYLIFRRPFPLEIPKFIVGYPWYDTWMVVAAQRAGIPVIDASRAIFAIHQPHQFREGTIQDRENSPHTKHNASLAQGMDGLGQTVSAEYVITIFDVLNRERLRKEEQLQ